MRRPVQRPGKPNVTIANSYDLRAPLRGLNSKDSPVNVPDSEAFTLDNLICSTSRITVRLGAKTSCSGFPEGVKLQSFLPFRDGINTKLFVSSATDVYQVVFNGTVGPSVFSHGGGYWVSVNGATAGVRYILAVNGVNIPKVYTGISWADAVITGLTPGTVLNNIHQSKTRIYFTAKDSLSFWFLGVNSFQGPISEFPLGTIFNRGGSLLAINSWVRDGGESIAGYTVFITTEGEVAIYDGFDPSSANNWVLIGVYNIQRPIGRKCFMSFGGDLLVLTQVGVVSLNRALSATAVDGSMLLSDKITGDFRQYSTALSSVPGWEMISYSDQNIIMVNIPLEENGQAIQYIWEATTRAWTRFIGWNAVSFVDLDNLLYFCTGNIVAQAFKGNDDFGTNILVRAKTAYSGLGQPLNRKHIKMYRPNFKVSGNISISFGISTDYELDTSLAEGQSGSGNQAIWDLSLWDQAFWAADSFIDQTWRTTGAFTGSRVSFRFQINAKGYAFEWHSLLVRYSSGSTF